MPAPTVNQEIAEESTAPASRDRDQTSLVAILGAATAFVRGVHLDHIKHGTILLHPYFVGFYLASYQDGFRRRALVGSMVRLLSFPMRSMWSG